MFTPYAGQNGKPRETHIKFQGEVRQKNPRLEEMQCESEASEERVGKQEQYSSNLTMIIDNFPIYDVHLPLFVLYYSYSNISWITDYK